MSEHYFTQNPNSEIKEKLYQYTIKNSTLTFKSVSGVFSFDTKVDKASELLIENFKPSGKSVLDLGCGYGPIGLFIKSFYSEVDLHMADINNRALEYAAANAKLNDLQADIRESNLYSGFSGMKFSDIVSNPPIAAGKKLYTQLIQEAPEYLEPNGSLWLVAFHNKGGSTLKEIMQATFGNVEDVEKSGGIRVYRSVKSL